MSHFTLPLELPDWDASWEKAGRENAQQLAAWAQQRPAQMLSQAEGLEIGRVGICGAGIMGAGIAAANVQHRIPVNIYDAAQAATERTVAALHREFGLPTNTPVKSDAAQSQVDSPTPLVTACLGQDDLSACDLIIETVVENRELKQQVLAQLASVANPQTLLATNTSTVPLSELATAVPHPQRFCGLHFCNPVANRRAVEIIRSEATSEETLATAAAYVTRIGKLPIVVQDRPGFLVNRLLLPYLNEALEMVCQGADLRMLDKAARTFGMPMGPFELFDLIGTDTAMWAGRTLWEAYPDRIALTPVLPALVKRNRLGHKTGRGFYCYESADTRPTFDSALMPILAPYLRRTREFSQQEITLRLFLPMLVEATRAIEEGIVQDVRDVDLGLLFGLAFPESRGGLLFWADTLGPAKILELLKPFESLGKRMLPTPLLQTMAETGQRYYELGSGSASPLA